MIESQYMKKKISHLLTLSHIRRSFLINPTLQLLTSFCASQHAALQPWILELHQDGQRLTGGLLTEHRDSRLGDGLNTCTAETWWLDREYIRAVNIKFLQGWVLCTMPKTRRHTKMCVQRNCSWSFREFFQVHSVHRKEPPSDRVLCLPIGAPLDRVLYLPIGAPLTEYSVSEKTEYPV